MHRVLNGLNGTWQDYMELYKNIYDCTGLYVTNQDIKDYSGMNKTIYFPTTLGIVLK